MNTTEETEQKSKEFFDSMVKVRTLEDFNTLPHKPAGYSEFIDAVNKIVTEAQNGMLPSVESAVVQQYLRKYKSIDDGSVVGLFSDELKSQILDQERKRLEEAGIVVTEKGLRKAEYVN